MCFQKRVDTSYGRVKVSIYGDRSKEAIVTFHDIGLDADNNFQNFFQFGTVVEITEKFCVYNINAPGQEMDASPLGENYSYPSMDGLAQIVDTVVRHFRLTSFIGFGVGAGANVMLRYAVKYQEKLRALVLVNADCGTAGWLEWAYARGNISLLRSKGMNNLTVNHLMWHNFGKHEEQTDPEVIRQYRGFFLNHPNPGNLVLFMEAYLNRTEIVLQQPANGATSALNTPILKVPILQLVGSRSAFLDATVNVNTKLDPANTEWVKVSNACGLVLDEKPEEVTESLLLFLQGLGY
ncbi:hypothetical protein M3Y98_00612200 [Aphelenchoides besseyi]|nr:hypothetical protein M3Y98_00612200 [Aphelenchoides besseyi]KAI6208295.1 hypothetical protein M3Y96_00100100 [Aphelenchoides besseyi]